MKFKSELGPFRTQFAENVFKQKYGHLKTWGELARVVVDDVCGTRGGTLPAILSKEDLADLQRYITEMKFIPGGRYLYYAGRDLHAYNNCLGGETKVLTNDGWLSLKDNVGKELMVVSPIDSECYPAKVHSHGVQKLNKITFGLRKGSGKKTWTVRATANHRWPLIDGTITEGLKVGDVVPAVDTKYYIGIAQLHGMVFADGTMVRVRQKDGYYTHQLRLCGDKAKYLDAIKSTLDAYEVEYTVSTPGTYKGDTLLRIWTKRNLKELPTDKDGWRYIGSFLRGWFMLDGCKKANQLHSTKKENIEFFVTNAQSAGFVITGEVKSQVRDTAYKKQSEIFRVNFQDAETFSGFKVLAIEPDSEEEVFCPYEPVHNRIIIDSCMDTGNCYSFDCLEDTREEWGRIVRAASDSLMLGGGIGICYSRLRGKGSLLKRTGGRSSGPLPLMFSVNEIGRNVMQGGSRRSAIYGSLHWWHPDIPYFMTAKNWAHAKIGRAKKGNQDYTLHDAKVDDFNFPAPLDMTNISINYDDSFLTELSLHEYKKTPPAIWVENCRQALMTGEPGMSFNFRSKQDEYLRNACCEFTTKDDSDICNLGSLNLANIVSFSELQAVTWAATTFLLCGSMRADLPGPKFYAVREKNRRIGLGLMGVHEWLLRRGYKYQMVPELRNWLDDYASYSTRAAHHFCKDHSISPSTAQRAVAPTGTIGIMASTSTGIEPLFATAFKRRYLVGGSQWKYEYVVDATADLLINELGVKADDVETASSLAGDVERRISFQADVQDYVDMAISSTINLPEWGTDQNNESKVLPFARTLAKYAPRLRGFTCYPNGARGGQPLTAVDYEHAKSHKGVVFDEVDICDISNRGGTCGS